MAIVRADMLAYTRKMNLEKHCFSRIATMKYNNGVVSNVNVQFLANMRKPEQVKILEKLKTVPFDKNLREIRLVGPDVPKSIAKGNSDANQLFKAIIADNLCNIDLAKMIPFALNQCYFNIRGSWDIIVAVGCFEIPVKRVYEMGSGYNEDSGETYSHIIVYMTNGDVEKGIMYPAYERGSIEDTMDAR